jgi:hypothetical protein
MTKLDPLFQQVRDDSPNPIEGVRSSSKRLRESDVLTLALPDVGRENPSPVEASAVSRRALQNTQKNPAMSIEPLTAD